MLNIWK